MRIDVGLADEDIQCNPGVPPTSIRITPTRRRRLPAASLLGQLALCSSERVLAALDVSADAVQLASPGSLVVAEAGSAGHPRPAWQGERARDAV